MRTKRCSTRTNNLNPGARRQGRVPRYPQYTTMYQIERNYVVCGTYACSRGARLSCHGGIRESISRIVISIMGRVSPSVGAYSGGNGFTSNAVRDCGGLSRNGLGLEACHGGEFVEGSRLQGSAFCVAAKYCKRSQVDRSTSSFHPLHLCWSSCVLT
jgi:hypothetical protein